MPRNGGGIYSKGSPSVVTGTTIQSAAYNTTIDDLVTDANAARPISAGGTGAANAAAARTNLGISATNTPFTPAGNIAATDVQAALAELDTEKAALAGATFTGGINGTTAAFSGAVSGTTGTFSGVVTGADASADGHLLNRITADGRFQPILPLTWTDIASAATMDVGAVASENLSVTGSVTVTSLGTAASGVTRTLRAAAGFQLTHSANIVCPAVQNIVLAADDLVRVASLGGGVWIVTDKTLAFDDTRLNGVPFTKIYTSAQQTYTIGGTLTLAHGLGEVPKFAFVVMRCITAELNYSVNDEFFWTGHADGDGSGGRSNPPLIVRDGTNLVIRYAPTFFRLPNKNTNDIVGSTATAANWRAIFVAVA
jgi:hypothetical protein